MLQELKKASKIAERALRHAKSMSKPGELLINIAESTEQLILDLGGELAFPINLSINDIAAHYTPYPGDNTSLKEGDVLKIDLGVHIDGWIVDTAITIEIDDNKYKELIDASKKALEEISKRIHPDISIGEIGKIVEDTITRKGFEPIRNLSGHQIERYILHAGKTIPNYDTGETTKLGKGIFAIEPFATTGKGYVVDDKPSTIYILNNIRPVRIPSVRKLLERIANKYKTLPFCLRWIRRDFPDLDNIDLAINLLKRQGIIYEYSILVEQSKGIVSQHEKTFYVMDEIFEFPER